MSVRLIRFIIIYVIMSVRLIRFIPTKKNNKEYIYSTMLSFTRDYFKIPRDKPMTQI